MQTRINQVNELLKKKNKNNIEIDITIRKHRILQLNEMISVENSKKNKIDKKKLENQSRRVVLQKIRNEAKKLKKKALLKKTKYEKFLPVFDIIKKERKSKINVNKKLDIAMNEYKPIAEKKGKLINTLGSLKKKKKN